MSALHECPLCRRETTTSLCAQCVSDVEFLDVVPPDPNATYDEVIKWAKDNKVTVFACGK